MLSDIEEDRDILEDINLINTFRTLPVARQRKVYKPGSDPFELNDKQFWGGYRFDKETATYIINLLNIEEHRNNRGMPISGSLQVLTALRFFGTFPSK